MSNTTNIGGPLHPAEAQYRQTHGAAPEDQLGDRPTGEAAEVAAIALKALVEMAQHVRAYGASAGLALLCGRICARMEFGPAAAAQFAAEVARSRTQCCLDHLYDVSAAAAALGRTKSAAKAKAARENGKSGGRPRTRYELAYYGGAMDRDNRPIRYRRYHETIESARGEHARIAAKLMGCCSGVICGPGCGDIGIPA